jgi:aspartyl/asparaginyl beta-hydroxylase (cupin superfamily)
VPKYRLIIDLTTSCIIYFTDDAAQPLHTDEHSTQISFDGELPAGMTHLNCAQFRWAERSIVPLTPAFSSVKTDSGWLDSSSYAFASVFEDRWRSIQQEALALLSQGHYTEHVQSRQSSSSSPKLTDSWEAFNIKRHGAVCSPHLSPVTWGLLQAFEEIMGSKYNLCYFSMVPSGGVIDPHQSNLEKDTRHRHQLCLKHTHCSDLDRVYLQVSGEKRGWQEGKLLSFDDAYMHDVKNLSNDFRLVLLFDSTP